MKTCETCVHWDEFHVSPTLSVHADLRLGRCRRFPPLRGGGDGWAVTKPTDVCGEHEEKGEAL